jgi:hypothetical protein
LIFSTPKTIKILYLTGILFLVTLKCKSCIFIREPISYEQRCKTLPIDVVQLPTFKVLHHTDICRNADVCLYVRFGNTIDYARLYFDEMNNLTLSCYLVDGCAGVSVSINDPQFNEYYITLILPMVLENNRFFVNKLGETTIISLKNISDNDVIDFSDKNSFEMTNSAERRPTSSFSIVYPELPKHRYYLNAVVFYDSSFKSHHDDPKREVIQIFKHVNDFLLDPSLKTKLYIDLKNQFI